MQKQAFSHEVSHSYSPARRSRTKWFRWIHCSATGCCVSYRCAAWPASAKGGPRLGSKSRGKEGWVTRVSQLIRDPRLGTHSHCHVRSDARAQGRSSGTGRGLPCAIAVSSLAGAHCWLWKSKRLPLRAPEGQAQITSRGWLGSGGGSWCLSHCASCRLPRWAGCRAAEGASVPSPEAGVHGRQRGFEAGPWTWSMAPNGMADTREQYCRFRSRAMCAIPDCLLRVCLHPQGQGDLLKNAKNEALENMKQIQLACLSCGLSKTGSGQADAKSKRCLEAIQEKDAGDENGRLWGEAELSHLSQISITLNYFFKAFKNSHRNALCRVLIVLKSSQCQYFNAVNLSKLNSGSEISNEAKLSVCKCMCVCAHMQIL